MKFKNRHPEEDVAVATAFLRRLRVLRDQALRAHDQGERVIEIEVGRKLEAGITRVLPGVTGKVIRWGDGTPENPSLVAVAVIDMVNYVRNQIPMAEDAVRDARRKCDEG